MIKLLTIVGARPQFIKAAALSRAIAHSYSDQVQEVIVHTGQHYDANMSEVFFQELHIPRPDHLLGIGSGSHGAQTGQMIEAIEKVILEEKPHGLVLYGDTNSTLAGALAAAKLHVPVIHIEAGLRSYNKGMPEEINRIACDHVSTLLFSPTLTGLANLKDEGIAHHPTGTLSFDRPGVYHSGDLMYDNTLFFKKIIQKDRGILGDLQLEEGGFVLATIHRPSNADDPAKLLGILGAMEDIASGNGLQVVIPLHPRTRKILEDSSYALGTAGQRGMVFTEPVSFLDMVRLEKGARLVLTDSGGVQKEAWFMEKPVVVLREETEWVEIIEAGNGLLAGARPDRIARAARHFLKNPPSSYPPLFGDGKAAEQVLKVICEAPWH